MFCPQCRSEYRQGFTQCHACEVPLVAELNEPEPGAAPDWQQLCLLSSDTDAGLLQGLLESASIPCETESLVFHAEPVSFGALGRVRVYVPREHLKDAQELLAQLEQDA